MRTFDILRFGMLARVVASITSPRIKTPAIIKKSPLRVPPFAGSRLRESVAEKQAKYGTSVSSSIKVVTDIDDTVKSSGGVCLFGKTDTYCTIAVLRVLFNNSTHVGIPLGGIDTHFKRGEFYPGVFQFLLELSAQNSLSDSPPKVAVLTARAREFLFALALKPADKLCSAFRQVGIQNGFADWGVGVGTDVYYGSVVEWILQNRKGIRKFDNFEIMLKNDASRGVRENYVLVGDTGERDEEAGERIARMYPKRIKAVFLHAVTSSKDRAKFEVPADKVINGVPFLYYQTYVGAAIKAKRVGLMGAAGVNRVIAQARRDLAAKEPRTANVAPSSKWLELERDIAMAGKDFSTAPAMFSFLSSRT